MNRLPTKQIYLLTIIIVGIIALSVYSTYAIFTFESETSDIVSIHTPKSLKISENIYEYQQLIIDPNTTTTTDIDIYNPFEHEVCYSIWYKIIGNKDIQDNIQIFEISQTGITSSGILQSLNNIRVSIAIINDNDEKIKINIGTIGSEKDLDSCKLNLTEDKSIISQTYGKIEKLTTKLLEEKDKITSSEENYLTYIDITEEFTFKEEEKIFLSDKFKYKDELFTLEEPEEITIKELLEKKYLEAKGIYFCKETNACSILYKIKEINKEILEEETIYKITKYDKFIGYMKGNNGLKKVNDKDYIYYGDNPNNFIYYNCKNNLDIQTCELWRIIGFFYNEETDKYQTKIIRNDSIGKYNYDELTNNWNDSKINKYLNEEYKLSNQYNLYIEPFKEQKEQIKTLESELKDIKVENEYIDTKIRLLNLSDYLNTSICTNLKANEYKEECITNNWLNNNEIEKEWTITSKEVIEEKEEIIDNEEENTDLIIKEENKEEKIKYIYSVGKNIEESNIKDLLDVRPTIYLKSRMLLLDGTGTKEEPYIVK